MFMAIVIYHGFNNIKYLKMLITRLYNYFKISYLEKILFLLLINEIT